MEKHFVSFLQTGINTKDFENLNAYLKKLCESRAVLKITPIRNNLTCPICYKNYPIEEIITLDCNHKFCKADIRNRLSSIITNPNYSSSNEVVCPECFCKIEYETIRANVPKHVFAKYDENLTKSWLDKQPKPQPEPKKYRFKCLKCKNDFDAQNIRTFYLCDHTFCEKCLENQFLNEMQNQKNLTRDSILCLECKQPIPPETIKDVLRPQYRDQYEEILNKPFLIKSEKIQLPILLTQEQIEDFQGYIDKIKKKSGDFQIEGEIKERSLITVQYYKQEIYEKLNRKIKGYDVINTKLAEKTYPLEWRNFEGNTRIDQLEPNDPKYIMVSTEFQKTAQNQIISISEIKNKALYQKYQQMTREQIEKKRKLDPNIDPTNFERYLWHGTRQNNPEIIYLDEQYGFDFRNANDGCAWGPGTYFGTSASVSLGYIQFRNAQGNYILLYNKVFVGETVQGQGRVKKPPKIPGSDRYYDSLSNGSMVVIYDFWRAYPHYIIEFR